MGLIKNKKKSLNFILISMFILFMVYQTVLIINYMNVPKISEKRDYIYGISNYEYRVHKSFDWSINFFDKKISNIENIIIYICMLWGFMRLIDLLYFLEKYKIIKYQNPRDNIKLNSRQSNTH